MINTLTQPRAKMVNVRAQRSFIAAIESGQIVADIRADANNKSERVVNFQYTSTEIRSRNMSEAGMSETWDIVDDGDWSLLYRTNGIFTDFVAHNPNNTRGAFNRGALKTTDGKVVNVVGGWSSRPGVVHQFTGIELIEVCVEGCVCYLNMDVAMHTAPHLGLRVGPSQNQIEDEMSWAFYDK